MTSPQHRGTLQASARPCCRAVGCNQPPDPTSSLEGDLDWCPTHLTILQNTRQQLSSRDEMVTYKDGRARRKPGSQPPRTKEGRP